MKFRILIRAFTARRDVSSMMLLKRELIKQNCKVKISSQREFLLFLKFWKPHITIVNTVGISDRIKKLSKNTQVVYIPGEGSEVGKKSDAYFWKNNPSILQSLDLALLWGRKQTLESKQLNIKKENIFYHVGNHRIDIINYFLKNKNNLKTNKIRIGFAARFDSINLHEFKSRFKILIQEDKFEKFINKTYQFKAFLKILEIILENTNYYISIRPHPLEQIEGYYEYVIPKFKKYKNRIEIDKGLDQVEWLSKLNVLISPTSSILVTAYLYKIPFINIDKLAQRADKTIFDIIDQVWQNCSYIPETFDEFIKLIKKDDLKYINNKEMNKQLKDYYLNDDNNLISSKITNILTKHLESSRYSFFYNFFIIPKFLLEILDNYLFFKVSLKNPSHWNLNYHKKKYKKPRWIDNI